MDYAATFRIEVRGSCQDNIVSARQGAADSLIGISAHEDRFSPGDVAKAAQVLRQVPRHLPPIPDDPVPGHGDDQADLSVVSHVTHKR